MSSETILKPELMMNRRLFMKQSAVGAVALHTSVGRWSVRHRYDRSMATTAHATLADPTFIHALAMRGIDAAKAAGATYADVRVTRQLDEIWNHVVQPDWWNRESLAVGVRVLVNGCWGFAASPYWDADDVVLLARKAAGQASGNAHATPRTIVWGAIPVTSGHWNTPIEVDPFTVPIEEKLDLVRRWEIAASNLRKMAGGAKMLFSRQERAVATTEGAYFTQTLYQSGGGFEFWWEADVPPFGMITVGADIAEKVGAGWEYLRDRKVIEQFPRLVAEAEAARGIPHRPGEIGRYDIVCDCSTMSGMIANTIGLATELDRAMGYEANASGTSYLADPLTMLGTFQVGAPLINVTANRSLPTGLASVKWDDEGVEPSDFSLVKDGVLVDYQTTREQAAWLAPWYQKNGQPLRSHGCAGAQDALGITFQRPPNLELQPGTDDIGFDELVSDTKRGIAVCGAPIEIDFQGRTGFSNGGMLREIVDGKLGAVLTGLSFLFTTTEFWKGVKALGGPQSRLSGAVSRSKMEPSQTTDFTVRAVPAKIANVNFIDPRRRA